MLSLVSVKHEKNVGYQVSTLSSSPPLILSSFFSQKASGGFRFLPSLPPARLPSAASYCSGFEIELTFPRPQRDVLTTGR